MASKITLETITGLSDQEAAERLAQEGPNELPAAKPAGEGLPFVYSGTLILGGRGIARVLATGGFTQLGRIGRALHKVRTEETLLQKETDRLVRNLAGIALAMAVLPEEFPVVLTLGAGTASILWFEGLKALASRYRKNLLSPKSGRPARAY